MYSDSEQVPSTAATGSLYDLVEELTQRVQRGDLIDLDQVIGTHPEYAERLRQVFPALQILAEVASTASEARPARTPDSQAAAGAAETIAGTLGDYRIVREIG